LEKHKQNTFDLDRWE